jgi:hypothetical protein
MNRFLSLCRFWLAEIWTPEWDAHRRWLLARHFWSYFRYRPIPSVHLPPVEAAESEAEQRAFAHAYARRIAYVQQYAQERAGVFLTYRPIGKNLRLMGTALRANVDRDCATFIEDAGPPTEESSLASRGYAWSPWLWSRSAANHGADESTSNAAKAWNSLFRHPGPPAHASTSAHRLGLPPVRSGLGAFGASEIERVLRIAVATRYAFSPTETTRARALKAAMSWPSSGVPVLGVHVRRGDAATSDGESITPRRSTRASYPLTDYLEAVDLLRTRYGIRHVFLATESEDEAIRARRLRPGYTFHVAPYDRSIFPDIAVTGRFIEDVALEQPHLARELALTAILDLAGFCECHAFVGTFNSEFSVLAWLLACGTQGRVVPFVSLSKPAGKRSLHPFDALLNLRNNVPLELWHW